MQNLLLESLKSVLLRDLDKLAAELELYPTEESIWIVKEDIKNPAGNLCLHLCGNLQHYIGAILGKSSYVRNRDLEFAAKNIARKNLLEEISKTKKAVEQTLPSLSQAQLESDYPVDVFGKPMKTLYFLVHLVSHFGYHLGQVNYHRRLINKG
jgi:uncharacterized damage-inducible protein DinB